MTGEECKFLHPAPCRKYIENRERSFRVQCKHNAQCYHPELCKYSRAQGNVTTIDASEYIPRAQGQANPTCNPGTKYNSTNYKSATSYGQTAKSGLRPPPTQHTTATHDAPSPTHYHTPPTTQYLTTHQATVPLYHNPPPLHAIPYTTSPSSTPTQSLHPPQTSAHAPQTHYPTFPRIVIPPQSHKPQFNTQDGYQRTTQRGTTANDHNIFLWEVMHNV